MAASATCRVLLRQVVLRASPRTWAKTGKRKPARMAMIAITTSSSMSVNPLRDSENIFFSFAGERERLPGVRSAVRLGKGGGAPQADAVGITVGSQDVPVGREGDR